MIYRAASGLRKGITKVLLFGLLGAVLLLHGPVRQAAAASYGYDLPGEYIPQEETGASVRNNILSFENDRAEAGVPLMVKGAPKGSVYHWKITGGDGSENTFTTTDNFYTPSDHDMEKLITVTADGLDGAQALIYYSSLPVIYINNTDGYYGVKEEYLAAAMSMQGNGTFQKKNEFYKGDINIRLRGNSTKWRDKRPFNIKLDSKADLFGMGKNKHWALLANDIDHTLMRNKLLYDFSGAIGMDVYSKSENVVLVFNNQYYGVYQLCEQVDLGKERVDIYDWEESAEKAAKGIVDKLVGEGKLSEVISDIMEDRLEDALCQDMSWISAPFAFHYDADQDGIAETYTVTDYIDLPKATGGVLLEMDFFAFDGHNRSTMITDYSQPLYFKSPEYAITAPGLFDYVKKYVQAFEYALHSTDFTYHEKENKFQAANRTGGNINSGYRASGFTAPEYDGKHYSELFDLDSLVQNFLVCEFSMNWDGMKNSVFMYKDIDGLFQLGPEWDFDWAWGNINMYDINTWYPTSWHTTEDDFTTEQYYQTVQWNRSLIRDPYFLVRAYEKYKEIRGTVIEDMIKSGGTIDTYADGLKAAAAANDARWSYSYGEYKSVGFEESLANMKEFINTRVAWMDEQFTSLDSFIASLGYYKSSSELSVEKIDTSSADNYTEIEARVTDPGIAYVTFQVNGVHRDTAEVRDGRAICRISDSDLEHRKDRLNVVQISAMDGAGNYIIDTMEEGNYYNAKSNYAVFYSKDGYENPAGSSTDNTAASSNTAGSANAAASSSANAPAVTDAASAEVTAAAASPNDNAARETLAQPSEKRVEAAAVILITVTVIGFLLAGFAVLLYRRRHKRS